MLVDEYFSQLETVIDACGSVRVKVVHKDKRSDYVGYFRADLHFYDGSLLHVREFIFTRSRVIKDTYVYHYQNAEGRMIFRYDNTGHYRNLSNFPHHKHTPQGVISTSEPDLQTILDEILNLL
jgi:hypothetical protein